MGRWKILATKMMIFNFNLILHTMFYYVSGDKILPMSSGKIELPISLSSELSWASKQEYNFSSRVINPNSCLRKAASHYCGTCFSPNHFNYEIEAPVIISELVPCGAGGVCMVAASRVLTRKLSWPQHLGHSWSGSLKHIDKRLVSHVAKSNPSLNQTAYGSGIFFLFYKALNLKIHGTHWSFGAYKRKNRLKRNKINKRHATIKIPLRSEDGYLSGFIGLANICNPEHRDIVNEVSYEEYSTFDFIFKSC